MEEVMDEGQKGLELTPENVDSVLDEIRPYLVGTGGGGLDLVEIDGVIVKVRGGRVVGVGAGAVDAGLEEAWT